MTEGKEGRLNPVVGRDREIERLIHVLARMDKSSAVLVGEAGVGKTAIVEGLAARVASGQVPEYLKKCRIIEVAVSTLVEGTIYRGMFEEKLNSLIKEASQKDIVLFIDEIHTLMGAGQAGHGSLDAGNILKPALARGTIKCIGATTPSEFAVSIEKDAAFRRRLEVVPVDEPSEEATIEILRRLKIGFEQQYAVTVADEAIQAAYELSVRYIPDRRLPDKARDVLMNASVKASFDSSHRKINPEDIAKVVEEATGVPVVRMIYGKKERLLDLGRALRERIFGQDPAIDAIVSTILAASLGLERGARPTGVFLFLGPSGVGKTALAIALSEELFGTEKALVRLDMSEFMEPHSVARLIGAPPGYIGYGDEGSFAGALKRRPYSLVLIDEIEKAHHRVSDLFLQLFDEGKLTDSKGNFIDARNAVFIMTSNVDISEKKIGFAARGEESMESIMRERLASGGWFRKELINRISRIVPFQPLEIEDVVKIADRQLSLFAQDIKKKQGKTLTWDSEALRLLTEMANFRSSGARAIHNVIRDRVMDAVSRMIIEDKASESLFLTVNETGELEYRQ